MFDILTFGSITLDIIIPLHDGSGVTIEDDAHQHYLKIPLGEKIKIEESVTLCGGGAANTAVGFSRLALNAATFGVLGDKSNKGFLIGSLQDEGVNTDYITFAKNQMSSFSVILNAEQGERTVIHRRTTTEKFNRDVLLAAPASRALYIGHLYDGPDEMLHALPEWKKKHEGRIGWNPGKAQFSKGVEALKDVFPAIDTLFLNVEEAEQFLGIASVKIASSDYQEAVIGRRLQFGTAVETKVLSDVRSLANKFMALGVKQTVLTDGARGAQIFNQDEHYWAPSTAGLTVKDTLGAGDAFATGVVAAGLHGKSLAEQIAWGHFSADGVIQQYGAQGGLLRLNEMEEKLSKNN